MNIPMLQQGGQPDIMQVILQALEQGIDPMQLVEMLVQKMQVAPEEAQALVEEAMQAVPSEGYAEDEEGNLQTSYEYKKGGYLKNKNTYVTQDGRETRRGLWANVHLKNKREDKYQEGGFTSVVDYAKASGRGASFAERKALAESIGIKNYKGTEKQNTVLLNSLQGEDKLSGQGRMDAIKQRYLGVEKGIDYEGIPLPTLQKITNTVQVPQGVAATTAGYKDTFVPIPQVEGLGETVERYEVPVGAKLMALGAGALGAGYGIKKIYDYQMPFVNKVLASRNMNMAENVLNTVKARGLRAAQDHANLVKYGMTDVEASKALKGIPFEPNVPKSVFQMSSPALQDIVTKAKRRGFITPDEVKVLEYQLGPIEGAKLRKGIKLAPVTYGQPGALRSAAQKALQYGKKLFNKFEDGGYVEFDPEMYDPEYYDNPYLNEYDYEEEIIPLFKMGGKKKRC